MKTPISMMLMTLAAIGVAVTVLLLPVEAGAIDWDGRCFCAPTNTMNITGTSNVDCAWAKMNAYNQAHAACGADGKCSYTVLFDEGGCTPDGPTHWEYDISVRQSCRICF